MNRNPDDIYLVGYGTLLYRASVGSTLGQESSAAKVFRPVRVAGYKRLFNLRPTHYEPSFRTESEAVEAAAMNVEPAEGAEFNGVAFPVTAEELSALDERERYYVRHEAVLRDFGTGEEIGLGQFYSAERDAEWIERDPARLLPRWRDVDWARRGAYGISESFGKAFDETTYLADGSTLMVDHYQSHLPSLRELASLVESPDEG